MPDISMCSDLSCPSAKQCKRSSLSGTKPSKFQSYDDFKRVGDRCDSFWNIALVVN